MIGVDWGTSSFRAFRIKNNAVVDRRESTNGIMKITDQDFAATLRTQIAAWLADGETQILMSGMIGSRQGWVEAAYLPCPAGAKAIAANLTRVPFHGADIRVIPGLSATDAGGTPEVMRGEETQIIGADATGIVCLPGSHSKWVHVSASGQIEGFETIMSGEIFAALRKETILGRMMPDAPHDNAAFDRGVARAAEPGHLLHHLFGVRSLALFDRLQADQSASYLSGLLIGHEIRAYLRPGASGSAHVTLLGSENLCALYTRAIIHCGGTASTGPADAAASGLALIGSMTRWT